MQSLPVEVIELCGCGDINIRRYLVVIQFPAYSFHLVDRDELRTSTRLALYAPRDRDVRKALPGTVVPAEHFLGLASSLRSSSDHLGSPAGHCTCFGVQDGLRSSQAGQLMLN
jgi:hypothetical protein